MLDDEVVVSRVVSLGFLVLAPLVAMAACGSEPLSSTQPEPVRSLQDFPAAYAAGLCEALARCCVAQRFDFDSTACHKSIASDLQVAIDLNIGVNVDFDPVAAQACIEESSSQICPRQPMASFGATPSCELVFLGQLEPGEPCLSDNECHSERAAPAFCDSELGCLVEPRSARGDLGETCSGTCIETVAGGLECFELFPPELPDGSRLPDCYLSDALQCAESSQTCVALLAIGEACLFSEECVEGAFCSFASERCEARRSTGPCAAELDACDASTSCDFEADECVPRRQADGTRCSTDHDCQSFYCNPYSVCQPAVGSLDCAGAFD